MQGRLYVAGVVLVFALLTSAEVFDLALTIRLNADYESRAKTSDQNARYLELYNAGRSGELVTVAGVANTATMDLGLPVYAELSLDSVDRTVQIGGVRVNLCRRDQVAVSGIYHYTGAGGWIEVQDPRNVNIRFADAWRGRFYHSLRLLFPYGCWWQ